MTDLILRLVELIREWINYLLPFSILGDDQVGLMRRFGKFHRTLKAGLNWKIPLMESALVTTSALDSTVLQEQSLTTKDNVAVTLRGVITYRVVDARKYILDCATAISVMNDVGCCVIAELIPDYSAEDVLKSTEFHSELLRRVKRRAKKWGVEVDSVGVIDRVAAPVYRIITSSSRAQDAVTPGIEL